MGNTVTCSDVLEKKVTELYEAIEHINEACKKKSNNYYNVTRRSVIRPIEEFLKEYGVDVKVTIWPVKVDGDYGDEITINEIYLHFGDEIRSEQKLLAERAVHFARKTILKNYETTEPISLVKITFKVLNQLDIEDLTDKFNEKGEVEEKGYFSQICGLMSEDIKEVPAGIQCLMETGFKTISKNQEKIFSRKGKPNDYDAKETYKSILDAVMDEEFSRKLFEKCLNATLIGNQKDAELNIKVIKDELEKNISEMLKEKTNFSNGNISYGYIEEIAKKYNKPEEALKIFEEKYGAIIHINHKRNLAKTKRTIILTIKNDNLPDTRYSINFPGPISNRAKFFFVYVREKAIERKIAIEPLMKETISCGYALENYLTEKIIK